MRISALSIQIIPDSRGEDTLQATISLEDQSAVASVPSGKSKGLNEAKILEPKQALDKFAEIQDKLLNQEFASLEQFDKYLIGLDGTKDKNSLGGNLILALSVAFCKAWAKTKSLQTYQLIAEISGTNIKKLPLCFYNLIEGGVHAKNSLPFQEYLIIPATYSAKTSLEAAQKSVEILKTILQEKKMELNLGDEGGFSLNSQDPVEGLKVLTKAIQGTANLDYFFGLDVAASVFFSDQKYLIGDQKMNDNEMLALYQSICANYSMLSIEDPFSELDQKGFEKIFDKLGEKVWIVGDDLTVTNPEKIKQAYEQKLANAVIIKPNQIGSVTEAITAALVAKNNGWKIIVSHRSGETMDDFIADLAVGLQADGLKSGAPTQPERLVKYNRLIEIENVLTSGN